MMRWQWLCLSFSLQVNLKYVHCTRRQFLGGVHLCDVRVQQRVCCTVTHLIELLRKFRHIQITDQTLLRRDAVNLTAMSDKKALTKSISSVYLFVCFRWPEVNFTIFFYSVYACTVIVVCHYLLENARWATIHNLSSTHASQKKRIWWSKKCACSAPPPRNFV